MKTLAKVVLALVITSVFFTSVAFAGDMPLSGFLGNQDAYDKLTPGPKDGAKLRWMKAGVNFSMYNKFMVDSVIFYLADDADNKGIDPQEMKELADQFNKALVDTFAGKYPIVADPGPDVARIRIAITNVKPSKPGISAVTSVVPIGLAVSTAKRGATGGWAGSGETCAEIMVVDSYTNDVILMAADQQKAAFASRFSKYGSAKDAFQFWSERIVGFIDNAKSIEREQK